MTGLRFLFRVTLRRLDLAAEIYHIKEPQKIPLVMSPDEAKRLLAMAGNLKVHVLLALGYGAGLRAGEVVRLRVGDIDRAQNIIRIVQAKGRKDRHVMLSPETLDLLRQWWKVRPARYDTGVSQEQRWLFPGRKPGKPMTTRQLNRLFHETAAAAGIKKAVTLHAPQFCERCRTVALGGHVARCEGCAHTVIAYNSCRNRHCPKCQGAAAREWLEERQAELLPAPYFHVVYTLPGPIADIAYQNKTVIYDILSTELVLGRPRAVTAVPAPGLADVDRGPRGRPAPVLRRARGAR